MRRRTRIPDSNDRSPLWRALVLHTCILQHVGPLPTRALMAMFQMLPEMIRTVELLLMVALPEFVYVVQMISAYVPLGWVGKLLAAVAADVGIVGCAVESGLDAG